MYFLHIHIIECFKIIIHTSITPVSEFYQKLIGFFGALKLLSEILFT